MLKTRVITALFLVVGLGLILFALPPIAATLTFVVIAALAAWEWGGLMGLPMPTRYAYGAVMASMCGLVAADLLPIAPWLFVCAATFWLGVVPFWFRFKWAIINKLVPGSLVGVLVILPTGAAMAKLHALGVWVLLGAMALVWVADIAAYFAGRAFGRHKLAPGISPGKTWEGVAGAFLGVLVYGGCLLLGTPVASLLDLTLPALGVLLAILTAVSVMGDLFESLLKRQAGIKDSSQLLPGHGGVLDRIDALTSTLPVMAFVFLVFPA